MANVVNGNREQAWRDTLDADELVEVARISDMPPSMAISYVHVQLTRRIEAIEKPKRSVVRDVTTGAGGGLFALTAAVVAYLTGLAEKIPK